jgi:hypothetical protein
VGSCEHGNEPAESIKGDEYLDWLREGLYQNEVSEVASIKL